VVFNRSSYEFLAHYLKAYPARSAVMIGLLVMAGLLELVGVATLIPLLSVATSTAAPAPGSFAFHVNQAMGALHLRPTIATLLVIIVTSITLKATLSWLAMRQVGYTIAQVATDLRLSLVQALLRARWSHFGSQPLGRYANAIGLEANASSGAYREACSAFAGLVQIFVYIGLAFAIAWRTTLIALATGAVILFVLRRFVDMARNAGRQQVVFGRTLAGRLVEALQGLKALKAMAAEAQFLHIMEKETEALNVSQKRRVMASETLKFAQEPLVALFLGIALYVMLALRDLPFATVLALTFIFYRLMTHMNSIQVKYQLMAAGESAFWSIREQIEQAEAAVEEMTPGGRVPRLHDELRFENVHFGYGEKQVLRGLSLRIPAGSFVALVGHSGAGKTTVIDLLTRLHTPSAGRIMVDSQPLEQLDLRAWRHSIGYVPQEILLFNGSIMENVSLGDASITREQVERALRAAGAWTFVSERPGGMDSLIGNSGVMLSGGQRQRLAIARAIVRQPQLLILDEVTASLDPISEAEICDTLSDLKGEVTIVAISHQQALRDTADIVYKLENGVAEPLVAPAHVG
jgi:ATP-binding cassette subfamily C protein